MVNREQLYLDLGLEPPAERPEPAPAPARSGAPPRPPAAAKPVRTAPAKPRPQPLHYSHAMLEVVTDIVGTLEELRHVELDRVLIAISQARQQSKHGVYASCVPLRFENGSAETVIRGARYRMPELRSSSGHELLYIVYFMLPRFHEEIDYREKLATVIHELYHISPHFNGDIRRFPGKNYAHGHSREQYHAAMRTLADRYLRSSPRAHGHEFLKVPFEELLRRPGGVVGSHVDKPRLILISKPSSGRGRR